MAIQKYEAFIKVAEMGSFKDAALELGYTQAGISYLVNALERELGVALFVRDYGGAHLSANGADLLPHVQEVCNAERHLAAYLSELKHLDEGSVRVATFTSTAIQWLPGIAREFERLHPAIHLDIKCYDDQQVLEELVWRGDVDCGFVVFPAKRDLHLIPLSCDPLVVVVAKDHPLANAKIFPTEALKHEPYIKLASGTHSEMDELLERNGVQPHVRFDIVSDYAVMSLVSANLGYSVLPSLILRDAPFPLACIPPEVSSDREIAICVRSPETASVATKAFVEITRRWVNKLYKNQT